MQNILETWLHFEDWWLHPSLKEDAKTFERARIMLLFCIVAGTLCLSTMLCGWISQPTYGIYYAFVAGGHTLTCSSFILLRFCSSMRWPSLAILITTVLQLFQAPIWTGFIHSPVLFTYPLATMFMGIIGGHRRALGTGLALSVITVFHWVGSLYYPNFGVGPQLPWITMVVLIWCTVTAMALVMYNQRQEDKLLRRIQSELEVRTQAQQQTEIANQAKDLFIAYLSHEIRNPLTVIVASVEMLELSESELKKQQYMRSLQSASTGLASLLDDVLDFSSLERSRLDLNMVHVDVVSLVQEVHREFELSAQQKGLLLKLNLVSSVYVFGDRVRLKQVIVNLVSNAIKYTEQGAVTLAVQHTNESVEVSVSDTGVGISPKHLESIFEPFGRERSIHAVGVGLGLAICKGMLTLMDTELHVHSTVGEGSRFYFSLPLVQECRPSHASSMQKIRTLKGLKLLIVDDNIDIVSLYTDHFRRVGCTVRTCLDGNSAIKVVQEWKPDVLLMDLELPGLSGTEFVRTVQSIHPTLQIVLVTGSNPEQVDIPVFRELRKPTTLRSIQDVLVEAVSSVKG